MCWINIYHFYSRTDAATIIISRILNVLLEGKSSSDSNLIFMKSFLYLIGSSSFIISICFLVSFFNASLFISVEAKN